MLTNCPELLNPPSGPCPDTKSLPPNRRLNFSLIFGHRSCRNSTAQLPILTTTPHSSTPARAPRRAPRLTFSHARLQSPANAASTALPNRCAMRPISAIIGSSVGPQSSSTSICPSTSGRVPRILPRPLRMRSPPGPNSSSNPALRPPSLKASPIPRMPRAMNPSPRSKSTALSATRLTAS